MASQIKGLEFDVSNNELIRVRVQGRDVHLNAILLEHVEESSLSSIVETEEQDLGVLVVKT
jgi:hypothetical protein